MKKGTTLIAIMLATYSAFGQAVTINVSDMPVPSATLKYMDINSVSPPNAAAGTNVKWDYSPYHTTATDSAVYYPEADTFFTHAGVKIYRGIVKSFIPGLGYLYASEISFDTTSIAQKGIYVPKQGYDISAFSGTAGDSINFPEASELAAVPKVLIKFPFSSGSSWHSVSRLSVNFKLTLAAASLSNAPGTHVYYDNQIDSVVGWGKMRVYTPSGPSIYYDVLMTKIEQYTVDSFYLYGTPAPASLLSAFGIAQGQVTDMGYRINYYKKGSYGYLLGYSYPDATYTNPENVFVYTNNLTAATGVKSMPASSYSTVLYPNPSVDNDLNLQITGRSLSVARYAILNMKGAVVQDGVADMNGKNTLHISLDNNLSNGNYILQVTDKQLDYPISERFTIRK